MVLTQKIKKSITEGEMKEVLHWQKSRIHRQNQHAAKSHFSGIDTKKCNLSIYHNLLLLKLELMLDRVMGILML